MRYETYEGAAAAEQLPAVLPIYREVYAEPPYGEGPEDVAGFVKGWPRRAAAPRFRLVLAYDGDAAVGMTFGHQLPDGTGWWSGLLEDTARSELEDALKRSIKLDRASDAIEAGMDPVDALAELEEDDDTDPPGMRDFDVAEWPGRTFAVIELAVVKPYRGLGVGHRMHDLLLEGRGEERVTLLVRPEPEARPAQAMYEHLGYQRAGAVRPYDGAPVYDAMIRRMRDTRTD